MTAYSAMSKTKKAQFLHMQTTGIHDNRRGDAGNKTPPHGVPIIHRQTQGSLEFVAEKS